ncbi:hypothetical protein WOLCODRAFT_135231 [Wolfiporia cocos MD-104 SS10]|uniref:Uncharacterized protein n=1 Tax=Wolfiporia cocos (strain MD-104) TaxID=742152 RepID=A0A2H3JAE9_WOLCO|nr:hypothetical protein WOLCODRAFT_135231 [Wolfiporia cocos MD-104 SS10]
MSRFTKAFATRRKSVWPRRMRGYHSQHLLPRHKYPSALRADVYAFTGAALVANCLIDSRRTVAQTVDHTCTGCWSASPAITVRMPPSADAQSIGC